MIEAPKVHVLNHDLEDGAACATATRHVALGKGLTLAKSGSCCSPPSWRDA